MRRVRILPKSVKRIITRKSEAEKEEARWPIFESVGNFFTLVLDIVSIF